MAIYFSGYVFNIATISFHHDGIYSLLDSTYCSQERMTNFSNQPTNHTILICNTNGNNPDISTISVNDFYTGTAPVVPPPSTVIKDYLTPDLYTKVVHSFTGVILFIVSLVYSVVNFVVTACTTPAIG